MLSHEVDLTFSHGALRFMSHEAATMCEGTQMSMSIFNYPYKLNDLPRISRSHHLE